MVRIVVRMVKASCFNDSIFDPFTEEEMVDEWYMGDAFALMDTGEVGDMGVPGLDHAKFIKGFIHKVCVTSVSGEVNSKVGYLNSTTGTEQFYFQSIKLRKIKVTILRFT